MKKINLSCLSFVLDGKKKFIVAIATIFSLFLTQYVGIKLDDNFIKAIVAFSIFYVGGQGIIDFKKVKTAINSFGELDRNYNPLTQGYSGSSGKEAPDTLKFKRENSAKSFTHHRDAPTTKQPTSRVHSHDQTKESKLEYPLSPFNKTT